MVRLAWRLQAEMIMSDQERKTVSAAALLLSHAHCECVLLACVCRFGLAITGINLTADLVKLTKNHDLDAYFFSYGANWNSWHALYSTMLIKFDECWQEAKPGQWELLQVSESRSAPDALLAVTALIRFSIDCASFACVQRT